MANKAGAEMDKRWGRGRQKLEQKMLEAGGEEAVAAPWRADGLPK